MGTFQDRVQDYVGPVADTTALTDWLTSGAKMVVDRIPENKLDRVSTTLTDSGSGTASTGHRLVRAYKSNALASKIDSRLSGKVADTNSRYYATATYPVWYETGGSAFVKPSGGTIVAVPYPAVLYSDSIISSFPAEWIQAVVLYATVQACQAFIESTRTTMVALAIGSVTPPTPPSDFAFSVSVVIPTAPSAPSFTAISIPDVTITTPTAIALGTAPEYTKPTTTFSDTNLITYISTEEDFEKASVEINHQQTLSEKFGKDLYNELNEFNKELEIYKATLQKNIAQIQVDIQQNISQAQILTNVDEKQAVINLNKEMSEYQSKLQLFSNQISSYGQVVNAEISAHGALLSKYSALLNKYQADISLAVATYQTNLSKYNQNLAYYQTLYQSLSKELERAWSML